ncbi:MAG TPA: cupin domain-containing protein [Hyphomicrobiaceae bacterium]|nr:cupin domain-containing protein [Hyphomicrobiaceae bacterium]
MMSGLLRVLTAGAIVLGLGGVAAAQTTSLDPAVIAFKLPDQIAWTDNTRAGNRSAILQGDPTKPGPYAVLLQWLPGNMSRPHFHPNDRHFLVVSGTWWVGSGPTFDPNATVAMPAGSSVTHFAKGVHFDGAKDEPATILVWGEGPATSTPFAPPASK